MTALDEPVATAAIGAGYRIRLRTLLSLAAGRGSFRLAQLAATIVLLPVWGQRRYGVYAAAVTAFTWLVPLLQSGPEKTVLKLLPRAPRTGPQIVEAMLVVLWCLLAAFPIAFLATLASGERGRVAIYIGVAAIAAGSGATLLLAGLHRVTGRPWLDARSSFTLSIFTVLLIGLALEGLGPLGYVTAYVAGQSAVNVVLLTKLGRPSLRIRQRPGFLRRIVWTIVLMGGPEICLYLATSVVFAIQAASLWAGQIGGLFVVTIVWSAGLTLLMYALRVYAPMVSVRLVGSAAATGRARAAQLARWVIGLDLLWLAVFALVVWRFDVLALSRSGQAILVWAVVNLARTPSVMLTIICGYVLENSDARSTRITGAAALASLAVTTVAGLILIPRLGGLGMAAALVIGEFAGAGATIVMVRGHPSHR